MQDRTPTPGQEGRVLITPEDGSAPFYAKVEMADNPTQAGTPLNKSTLLQDSICEILGIPNTSVPNDAFAKLALGIGKYGYIVHVELWDGTPVPGAIINGLQAPSGETVITNENGDGVAVSTETEITISITSPYIDAFSIDDFVVESTGILTYVTKILNKISDSSGILIENSNVYHLSPRVLSFDVTAVGAGGGGGDGHTPSVSGAGGGGGYVETVLNVTVENDRELTVQIGAGGAITPTTTPQSQPSQGGATNVTLGENLIVSANGGMGGESLPGYPGTDAIGGDGNGKGGDGVATTSTPSDQYGESGVGYRFNDPSLGLAGGGGGGAGSGGNMYPSPAIPGGAPYGGTGDSAAGPSTSGTGPGGGGGGGSAYNGASHDASPGHNGGAYFRFHYVGDVG